MKCSCLSDLLVYATEFTSDFHQGRKENAHTKAKVWKLREPNVIRWLGPHFSKQSAGTRRPMTLITLWMLPSQLWRKLRMQRPWCRSLPAWYY